MIQSYTFATQSGKAYYCNSIPGFINDTSSNVLGQLVRHAWDQNKQQTEAWNNQISELQKRFRECEMQGDIIFEYDIVRLGKRIDIVLLIRHMVFSLEFKNGKNIYTAQDARQAEDYAVDIKNFHKESENLYVCPILIATKAEEYQKPQSIDCYSDKQIFLQRENIDTLVPKVQAISERYGDDEKIDFERWFKSPYHPTPTIIAAAVEAYATHDISKIAQSEAGQNNINACEKEINRIIAYAQCEKKKCICFVTGVPGAGKTLVGLDVVAKNLANGTDGFSVYLSGNGPLVKVLRAALKKSAKERNLVGRETESAINALIQNSFAFKRDNAMGTTPPTEKILIFDEAQRVWDEKKMKEKHNEPEMALSEPNLLYKIMDRHQDWAVMICLVGLGQDIYDGEVGINEWFKCGIEQFPEWELFYSNSIFDQSEDKLIDRKLIESCSRCHNVTALHLKTSVRSFRADKQCKFVDYLLDNNPIEAKNIYKDISCKYPIYVTRDLMLAKRWVKSQVRGSQRCGLLASSKALRLMAEGIYVPKDINVEKWFLAEPEDPRSSNRMEIAASEFKVQGLEVDWAIVGWDLDVRRNSDNSDWNYHTINATSGLWTKNEKKDRDKRYMLNAYRVLLTRARQGMVIYVPKGVDMEDDETRPSFLYDMIYDYLHNSCGIQVLSNE